MKNFLLVFLFIPFPFNAQVNEAEFHCIDSLTPIGNVQIYGYLVHGVGCDFTHMKIDGKFVDFKEGTTSLAKKLVKKKNLGALLFLLSSAYLMNEEVMQNTEPAIDASKFNFSEPLVQALETGYQARVWLKKSGQSSTKDEYSFAIITVNKKGEIKRSNLSGFTWDSIEKKVIN